MGVTLRTLITFSYGLQREGEGGGIWGLGGYNFQESKYYAKLHDFEEKYPVGVSLYPYHTIPRKHHRPHITKTNHIFKDQQVSHVIENYLTKPNQLTA